MLRKLFKQSDFIIDNSVHLALSKGSLFRKYHLIVSALLQISASSQRDFHGSGSLFLQQV